MTVALRSSALRLVHRAAPGKLVAQVGHDNEVLVVPRQLLRARGPPDHAAGSRHQGG